VSVAEIETVLIELGESTSDKKKISKDISEVVIHNFGFNPVFDTVEGVLADNSEKSFTRPPIVVVMGHVDHGKTSLLDKMRKTDIAKHEKGGITQHIGAYSITTKLNKKITFIDTPGHALFKEMRERGAKFTDIVVLVVAADDGIKEQTIEAIRHAQTAGSPIIVAINKIDKEGVNIERIRTELMNYNVVVEEFGGDSIEVQVSAKTGQGLEELQNAILLQAEMMKLKTYEKGKGAGVIIESRVDKGQGIVGTVLLLDGSLNEKDIFVCGSGFGKIRSMNDDHGKRVKVSGPSSAVVVCGFNEFPVVGDTISVVKDEKDARTVVEFRKSVENEKKDNIKVENPFDKISLSNLNKDAKKELIFIIKADVAGSLDALKFGIESLSNDEITVSVIKSEIGDISENDLSDAQLSSATVIGFNVKMSLIKSIQKYEKTPVKYYNIIYKLIDDVSDMVKKNMSQKFNERFLGRAEVIKVFDMKDDSGKFRVAGCIVKEGEIHKSQKIKIIRDGNIVFNMGEMRSLEVRRVNAEVVSEKEECGIVIRKYTGVEVGDIIECFSIDN
jgi:translation initiation factor IF-2